MILIYKFVIYGICSLFTLHFTCAQKDPKFEWGIIKAIGKTKIFLNWTLIDGNPPIKKMSLGFYTERYASDHILEIGENSLVLNVQIPSVVYKGFRIDFIEPNYKINTRYVGEIKTLDEDTLFIPKLQIKNMTGKNVKIIEFEWDAPKGNISEFYHYYQFITRISSPYNGAYSKRILSSILENSFKTILMLKDFQYFYNFKVQACSNFTNTCDPLSSEIFVKIPNVQFSCYLDNKSVILVWESPVQNFPGGKVDWNWTVSVSSYSEYYNEFGEKIDEFPTIEKIIPSIWTKIEFLERQPNTNYQIEICQTDKYTGYCVQTYDGRADVQNCKSNPEPPDRTLVNKAKWIQIFNHQDSCNLNNSNIYFSVELPAISQRNGTFCCSKIIVIRLGENIDNIENLPDPKDIKIVSYEEAHQNPDGGAYIAEIFIYRLHYKEAIIIGDQKQKSLNCLNCTNYLDGEANLQNENAFDGVLSSNNYYTGYLEISVVDQYNDHAISTIQSNYFPVQNVYLEKEKQRPKIISQEKYIIFNKQSNENYLNCSAKTPSTNDTTIKFQWFFQGQEISEEMNFIQMVSENESILNFPPILEIHEGSYVCQISNNFGFDEFTFNVKVPKKDTKSKDTEIKTDSKNLPLILSLSISLFFAFIISAFVISRLYRKNQQLSDDIRDLTEPELRIFKNGDPRQANPGVVSAENAYDDKNEISLEDLEIDEATILGSGQFGLVFKGKYMNEEIAVKTTKPNANVGYFRALLSELKIMSQMGDHLNIVKFIGASTKNIQQRKVYILVELCPLGNLESFLRKNDANFDNLFPTKQRNTNTNSTNEKNINTYDLSLWSYQIANGLEYIASKKVIHGDLAIRNVLLFRKNLVKITDFGLSKNLFNYSVYIKKEKQLLPWAWLSIESLKFYEFSTESDIWAYGVTIWEIFSLGQIPFIGYRYTHEFINLIDKGMRLQMPIYSNAEIFECMRKCWSKDPKIRPKFSELKQFFVQIMKHLRPDLESAEFHYIDI